jgi:hypothetical protein
MERLTDEGIGPWSCGSNTNSVLDTNREGIT